MTLVIEMKKIVIKENDANQRIDKYLKVTHIIKRREVAKKMLDAGFVSINDKVAKPASEVKVGDIVCISNPNGQKLTIEVKILKESCPLNKVNELYDIK